LALVGALARRNKGRRFFRYALVAGVSASLAVKRGGAGGDEGIAT
jgi:hypothetical protein